MAKPHIPNLRAIGALPDEEIKFYAIIGAVVSLGAGLELAYFDIFEKATRLERNMAASVFYQVMNTGARRDIANVAMCRALGDQPELIDWNELYKRIVRVTGQAGERNLVGHSTVTREAMETLVPAQETDQNEQVFNPRRQAPGTGYGMGAYGAGPYGGTLGRMILHGARYRVSQDDIQIMAGMKKAKDADFDSLIATCETVTGILNDLEAFLLRI